MHRLFIMESNAAGMVRRLALKTRFSEMGWGSTPLLSAKFRMLPAIKKTFIGKKQNSILLYYTLFAKLVRHRILIPTFGGSSPSWGAKFILSSSIGKDDSLSSCKDGFDSRTEYQNLMERVPCRRL